MRPRLTPSRGLKVIGGNGLPIPLLGFADFAVKVADAWICHGFAIVDDLPLDLILGAEILKPHGALLTYQPQGDNVLTFALNSCRVCVQAFISLSRAGDPQLRYCEPELLLPSSALPLASSPRAEEPLAALHSLFEIPSSPRLSALACPSIANSAAAAVPPTASPRRLQAPHARSHSLPSSPRGHLIASACPRVTVLPLPPAPGANAVVPPDIHPLSNTRADRFTAICKDLQLSNIPLPMEILSELKALLFEMQDAFSASDLDIGRTSLTQHTILTCGEPFREKLRQIPYARRALVKAEIDHLLRLGVIEPATPGECPYASAIVLVQKKDKSMRLCVDYRRLNAQTVKDAYNLPRIDDLLQQLARARYFVALDLLMGYHQIEVASIDRCKTAFVCSEGLFVYRVMPFGLCNAPATFQRLMNSVLAEHIGRDCVVYIDDVLLFAETPAALLLSLRSVLSKLIAAGLKCKSRKCSLFTTEILYLGFVISNGIIGPDPSKIEKIIQWPIPKTGSDIASFLGLVTTTEA